MAIPTKNRGIPQRKPLPRVPETIDSSLLPVEELEIVSNDNSIHELSQQEIYESQKREYVDKNPIESSYQIPQSDEIHGYDESPFLTPPLENNDYRNELNDDKYIDKKDMKIVPMGGKKVRAKDFDDRKNRITPLKVFRVILYTLISVLFIFGIKNTFFPSNNFTQDEISSIAQNAVGQTGFPIERGQAMAEEFIYYYLNLDPTDSGNKEIINRFYTGQEGDSNSISSITRGSVTNKQVVVGSPRTFEIINASSDTTMYKISAMVTDENGGTRTGEAGQKPSTHWVSFAVNVYYNAETTQLIIPEGNPYIIPTYELAPQGKAPDAGKLGTGEIDDDIRSTLFPTISGYIKAFALASVDKHNEIIQYIPQEANADLYTGFGGKVELARDDNSIRYEVFKTDDEKVWKVDVTIEWKDINTIDPEAAVSYSSRYVMTIEKSSAKKYLVTKFSPYYYLPKVEEE